MSTDFNAKVQKVYKSFSFAIQGIIHAFKHERNLKIHFVAALLVILLGCWLQLTTTEWLFVLLAIGGVITLELLNTAVERLVDLVTKEDHPLAKQAKDIAAGAVLVYAILSVLIGLIIFIPKLLNIFG
ncbi:diacylglycerol kinase family protein [Bacillus sp. 1NLA3E]|uniref:diacylglycerol kinase family protein n=1 Tax=Bacillus sp. 1NLA3E TaxID=666686 RepID=UPI000247EF00|nr:diacylglycerol kinase family protein [Bacillus sp. 1NLA3E]AGK54961.1 diacylglycerol kinase [Bacillus sp. 1NLA3E]